MLNKRELSMLALACAILVALILTGHTDPAAASPAAGGQTASNSY